MEFAIIAAGQGSRLEQEGVNLPKPLVRLCGTPMIKRLIDIFIDCGATSVNIIVNREMTLVRDYLKSLELPVPLVIVEETTPSSMHSFHRLSQCLGDGKFCLTTVDTIFRPDDFRRYIEAFRADTESDGFMAVTPFIDDEKPLYVDFNPDTMRITAFSDSPSQSPDYVSGGIYGLDGKALKVLDKCMEMNMSRMRNYQRRLLDEGLNLKAYPFDKIIDVDHAADIATATEFLK